MFVAVAVVSRLIFWLVTDRVWEDALITVTHARNAVAGIGLTHHPGEPVTHGFTSAVSVLVPLAGEIVVNGSGIFVLKVASLVAAATDDRAGSADLRALSRLGSWPTAARAADLAVGQNHIFYGMSGMETQIAVMVLLWSVDLLMAGGPGSDRPHVRRIRPHEAAISCCGSGRRPSISGARNWRNAVKATDRGRTRASAMDRLHHALLRFANPEHDPREVGPFRPGPARRRPDRIHRLGG